MVVGCCEQVALSVDRLKKDKVARVAEKIPTTHSARARKELRMITY